MLIIRKEQADVFKQIAFSGFENRMIAHLQKFTPRHFNILKEEDLRKVVRYGWEMARSRGFASERSVRLYIELMFMLGSGFDTDPQYPWEFQTVSGKMAPDESERIDQFHEKAWDLVDHASLDYTDGKGRVDPARLTGKLRKLHSDLGTFSSREITPLALMNVDSLLMEAFPNKYQYIGKNTVHFLITSAAETAKQYAVFSERGLATFVTMMFLLGCGFHNDPIFPWISEILNDPSFMDEAKKIDMLHAKALTFLERFWA